MKYVKPGPIRTFLAWIVGLSLSIFIFGIVQELLDSISMGDSIAVPTISILGSMLSARVGMAIYSGKLNGGVSINGNHLFLSWFASVLLLGCVGVLSETLLGMMLDVRWLEIAIEVLLLNGLGLLLIIKWNLLRKTSEDIYLHDAMVLHSALKAGSEGVTFGELCCTSDTPYSPDMSGGERLPFQNDVTLGMICRVDDPLFTHDINDYMSRDHAIQMSLNKLIRMGLITSRGNKVKTYYATPKASEVCVEKMSGQSIMAAISIVHDCLISM